VVKTHLLEWTLYRGVRPKNPNASVKPIPAFEGALQENSELDSSSMIPITALSTTTSSRSMLAELNKKLREANEKRAKLEQELEAKAIKVAGLEARMKKEQGVYEKQLQQLQVIR
jgi:hypothetical protein